MSKFVRATRALSAVPPLLLGVLTGLLVVGVPPLHRAFWPEPDTNAAEAVVLGDVARLRFLAARGDDLRARVPVRPGLPSSMPGMVTPLEAAIRTRNERAFKVLWEIGAPSTTDEVGQLRCVAKEIGATDFVERLSRLSDARGSCD